MNACVAYTKGAVQAWMLVPYSEESSGYFMLQGHFAHMIWVYLYI